MYIFLKFTNDNFNKEHIGDDFMLEKMAWNTFKNTGNIDTFMEYLKITKLQEDMSTPSVQHIMRDIDGNNKDEGNCTFRK